MKANIDLYKLAATIGEDKSLELIGAGIVERHVMHSVLNEYKQLNKFTYAFTTTFFNDGNNVFEETIYLDFKKHVYTYKHTMTDHIDMNICINNNDQAKLKLFHNAFMRVFEMHKNFGIVHSKSKIYISVLEELKND